MIEFNMESLEALFKNAKRHNKKYVAVEIAMEGFPKTEVIINSNDNIDLKLDYLKSTYDEDLNHKHSKGIKIVDFTYGDSMEEIEKSLF